MCALKFSLPMLEMEDDEVKMIPSSLPNQRRNPELLTIGSNGGSESAGDLEIGKKKKKRQMSDDDDEDADDDAIIQIIDDDEAEEEGGNGSVHIKFPKLSSPLARPLTLDEFRDGTYENSVNREWTELWKLCDKKAFSELGYEPPKLVGKSRNRYKDILPNKQTRVKLLKSPNPEVNCDYINANFVRDQIYGSERHYIAAQAPTDTSVEEFWVMVDEQNVDLIIMLTKEEEDGVVKSTKYWPDAERTCLEIDSEHEVRFESESPEISVGTSVIVRKFILANKVTNVEKSITQFQYVGWPDKDVPQDMTEYRKVVEVYRKFRDLLDLKSPILLHCSAGVGRTGTFIAIDIIVDHIQRFRAKNKTGEPSINVAALVFELRKQRKGMIQNKAQYKFICDFISYCSRTGELLDSENPQLLLSPSFGTGSVGGGAGNSGRGSIFKKNPRAMYSTRSSAQSFFGNGFTNVSSSGSSTSSGGLTVSDDNDSADEITLTNDVNSGAPTGIRHSTRGSFFKSPHPPLKGSPEQ